MGIRRVAGSRVEATVGYAADERGNGVAYARLVLAQARRLLRVAFRVKGGSSSADRAVAYAALTAVSRVLHERGFRDIDFVVADSDFVEEVRGGRSIGETLVIPYVRLRCALNALIKFTLRAAATDDLTQRARAEVALNVAA